MSFLVWSIIALMLSLWHFDCGGVLLGEALRSNGTLHSQGIRHNIELQDTLSWTSRTTPVDNQWRGICWSPDLGLFVAVSLSGSGNRVMTSSDGVTSSGGLWNWQSSNEVKQWDILD
eukprot:gene43903-53679_t